MRYLLSPYKKIYHKAKRSSYSGKYKSICGGMMRIFEDKVVLIVPKGYRPCKRCYKNEETTLIYQEENDYSI